MCGRAERDHVPHAAGPTARPPRSAQWQALRATRPPIECPTSAIRSTSTGHASTSASSSSASERPFSEMWRPLL